MSSESEQVSRGRVQATDSGKLTELSELIRGEQPQIDTELQDAGVPDEPPPEGEQPPPDADKPEPPSIDYDLVIPISASDGEGEGGESQTISQLKDHYQATKSLESDREAWEETRRGQENEQMVARQQLNTLAVMLGEVKPELLKAAQEHQALNAEHEARMLLQVKPEWATPAVKKQATDDMLVTALDYGFTEQQFMGIDDHKIIKLLHDYTVLLNKGKAGRKKLEAAANPPKAQKPASVPIKPTPADQSTKRTGGRAHELAAIGALIEKAESSDGKPSR